MTTLYETIARLGEQELLVLEVLARRLLEGQRAYGRLDLARDARDWRRERAAELADALVYTAIGEIASHMNTEHCPPPAADDGPAPYSDMVAALAVRRATT